MYLSLATCWEVLHVRNIRQLDIVTCDWRTNLLASKIFIPSYNQKASLSLPTWCFYKLQEGQPSGVVSTHMTRWLSLPCLCTYLIFFFVLFVFLVDHSFFAFVIFLSLTWSGWGSPGAVRVQGATHSVWPYLRFNYLAICFWRWDLVHLLLAIIFW